MRLPPLGLLQLAQQPGPLRKRALQADVRPRAGQLRRRGRAGAAAAGAAPALAAGGPLPARLLLRLPLLPELLQVVDGVEQALAVAQGSDANLHLHKVARQRLTTGLRAVNWAEQARPIEESGCTVGGRLSARVQPASPQATAVWTY